MEATIATLNTLVERFVAAIQSGGNSLAGYGTALLGLLFVIGYCQQLAPRLMMGMGALGDTLGWPLLFMITGGLYLFVLQQLVPMSNAILEAAVNWGMAMSGNPVGADLIRSPGAIMQMGLDIARPLADFDTTWSAIRSTIGLAARPDNLLIFWLILLTFLITAVHFGMVLIEFALSISLSYVLLPWGIWAASAEVGHFSLGWVTGCVIRALVSCAVIGIAMALLPVVLVEPAGFFHIGDTVSRLIATAMFGAIALAVPHKIAAWASRQGLALTGSTLATGAMTFARWGMMGHGMVRGFSHLVGR